MVEQEPVGRGVGEQARGRPAEPRRRPSGPAEPTRDDVRARLETLHRDAQRRLAALTASRAEVIAAAAGSNADDEHDPEGATLAFERQQLAALAERAGATSQQAEAALQRLDEGRYGSCVVCGRPIDADRLAALPAAARCLGCASAGRR